MKNSVQLWDYATHRSIEGEIFDEVTVEHFLETQRDWRPAVIEAAKAMVESDKPPEHIPQHFHWDWSTKEEDLRVLAFSFFGISCDGKLQGIMKVETVGHSCRLPSQKGKPVLYIDYLETAPWNIKALTQPLGRNPQFGAVGTRIIEAAVRQSLEEGFKGRLALHSLATSERFYLNVCGMTAVGRDSAKQNLLWFEFTPAQANKFLTEIGGNG